MKVCGVCPRRQKILGTALVGLSTALTDRPLWKQRSGRWPAGEKWGKMKKAGSRNVGKENGGCFSCSYDRVGRAGKLFVFLYSVKGIWLIF